MSYPNDPSGRQPESWEVQPTQYIPPAQQGYQQPIGRPAPAVQRQPVLNPFGTESNETFGIAGTVLALLGGVMGIVSLTALDWFSGSSFGSTASLSFSDIHDVADSPSFTGFASAYFSYLAWVFLVITVLAAVGSSFPSPAVRALRIIGVVIGVAAAGLSFLALNLTDGTHYSEALKHARVGFYLLVLAYILAAIGAGIGPTKVAPVAVVRR